MDAALYWDNKALPTPNSKLYLHFLFILFFIYIIFYLYIYIFIYIYMQGYEAQVNFFYFGCRVLECYFLCETLWPNTPVKRMFTKKKMEKQRSGMQKPVKTFLCGALGIEL